MYKHSLSSIISITIIASCFCLSCSNDIVYNKFQPIQDKVWDKQAEYFFTFDITDASVLYDISLQLRNNNMYPYQNLWVISEERHIDSIYRKDTLEFMLADDFGRWTGNGIALFQSQMILRDNYQFPDTGQYTIGIRHGMRDDKLKGIEDIGLHIEKSK